LSPVKAGFGAGPVPYPTVLILDLAALVLDPLALVFGLLYQNEIIVSELQDYKGGLCAHQKHISSPNLLCSSLIAADQ
jgi:hypothetical protein